MGICNEWIEGHVEHVISMLWGVWELGSLVIVPPLLLRELLSHSSLWSHGLDVLLLLDLLLFKRAAHALAEGRGRAVDCVLLGHACWCRHDMLRVDVGVIVLARHEVFVAIVLHIGVVEIIISWDSPCRSTVRAQRAHGPCWLSQWVGL